MRIFCIGDIVGDVGINILSEKLEYFKDSEHIHLIIANAENASNGRGITRNVYDRLSEIGIDGFTMGNHVWGSKDVFPLMQYKDNLIRPANYEKSTAGKGSMILNYNGVSVGVINLAGRVYMDASNSPFTAVMREISRLESKGVKIILVDFHAEATSEKQAMGWFLDGKVSAVFGTHTHVQTADECILTKGTGYITDLGMTGAVYSILGMDRKIVIDKFVTGIPSKFELAEGKARISGCIFDIDEETGKCLDIKRVNLC